jgi:glutamyl-tRNA reductase
VHLVVVGLNHRTAPIELRERLTFSESRLPEALLFMQARPEFAETAILSTCNRTELYAAVPHPGHETALIEFLAEYHKISDFEFVSHLYTHHDAEAARHLFRVASGIDSLVLGEPQVLRQVRDAYSAATEATTVGPLLNGMFRAAIATGRRARTETEISRGGFSVGHAAVDLARSIFGSLEDAKILILGAGKMSELTARHLVARGVKVVLVANRTFEKANTLAARLGGRAIHYDTFPEELANTDIVISSTAAPNHVLHRENLTPVLRKRRGRPLFLIDIAVPRDIDPQVGNLDNVFLYDVDDLEAVVADMAGERASEIGRVELLIAEETGKFSTWWRSLDAAPVVTHLREKHEDIRQSELARLRNQLPDLSDRAWQCIEAATRSMMNRVAKDPIAALKRSTVDVEQPGGSDLLDAAREIFQLNDDHCPRHKEDAATELNAPEDTEETE